MRDEEKNKLVKHTMRLIKTSEEKSDSHTVDVWSENNGESFLLLGDYEEKVKIWRLEVRTGRCVG